MIKYQDEKIKLIPLTDLAEKLEINKQKGWNWECFSTKHKNQKQRPSLSITNDNWFNCHKCDIKWWNAVDLYMNNFSCWYQQALEALSEMYHISYEEMEEFKKSPKHSDLLIEGNYKKCIEDFKNHVSELSVKAKNELDGRKISFDTAKKFKVWVIENLFIPMINTYNEDKWTKIETNYDVISFPILDNDRRFIWLKYRLFDEDYKSLPVDIGIWKSMNLWGSKVWLMHSSEGIDKSDEVLLCEWETDWLSLISLWYDNVVINMWYQYAF